MFPKSRAAVKHKSSSVEILPPINGWDMKAAMGKTDPLNCVDAENWYFYNGEWRLRGGHVEYSTGLSGDVNSLIPYIPTTGTKKLFAADTTDVFSIEAGGAVGAAVLSGKTNGKWQHVNMGTSGGQFLFICNGADTPQTYNGTVWAGSTITGPSIANLIWCNLHQSRLWVGETGSLTAYYGGVNSIGGAFTAFPLAGIASKGGYIMGMVTWTRDSGVGRDDVAVFVTSEGQALVYSGTDPSTAADWVLEGVYEVGSPIGRRFFCKAGGDAFLITELGFISMSSILPKDTSQSSDYAVLDKINGDIRKNIDGSGINYGWQPLIYSEGEMILLNCPVSSTNSIQYIVNSNTRSGSMFSGWNAQCFSPFNGDLYFGGKDGKVYKANYGDNDNGSNIIGSFTPAFNYCGNKVYNKKFNMMTLSIKSNTSSDISITQLYDLNPMSSGVTSSYSGAMTTGVDVWGSGTWGISTWGGETIQKYRISLGGVGKSTSTRISVSLRGTMSFIGGSILFETTDAGVL